MFKFLTDWVSLTCVLTNYEIESRLISRAHEMVRGVVMPGDTCVDATAGNGHDTLFLAGCVGELGRVIGFDIQAAAIASTQKLIEQECAHPENVLLHEVGHENMASFVDEPVAAIMFNLGYLPGSDKTTITRAETTLTALELSEGMLRENGLLSIMCYPGHAGGALETEAVSEWSLSQADSCNGVSIYRRKGARPSAPVLIVIQKKRSAQK